MAPSTALARLTVVVPVGPGDTLSPRLRAQLDQLPSQVRVVHANAVPAIAESPASATDKRSDRGGRTDSVADSSRWEVISAPPGRAAQQNAGARGAAGDWLWFLHADCELAADSLPALVRFIEVRGDDDVLGFFDLRFLDDGPALVRLNAAGAWIRSYWFGLPFGDQGLLMRREVFERTGGFDPAVACGEDHDLVWRLRRAGIVARAVGAPLFTSARRYAERGWWATTAWHLRETWRQIQRFSRAQAAR